MNSKKMFFAMLAICILLSLSAIGILLMGDSILKGQSKKLLDLKLENKLLEEQQASLTQADKDIQKYEDLEQIAKAVVPQDKDQARAVREIVRIASETGISINSISFPASNLGGTGSTNSSSATAAASQPVVSQAVPVQGVSGVYSLEMVITPDSEQDITYYQLLEFLERLENNRRTAQVTSVKVTPITFNVNNPIINFVLTINIFIKP